MGDNRDSYLINALLHKYEETTPSTGKCSKLTTKPS